MLQNICRSMHRRFSWQLELLHTVIGTCMVTTRHSDVPFFQRIVQVTVPLSKFRNSSFFRSFSNCRNCSFPFLVQFLLHIHAICKPPLHILRLILLQYWIIWYLAVIILQKKKRPTYPFTATALPAQPPTYRSAKDRKIENSWLLEPYSTKANHFCELRRQKVQTHEPCSSQKRFPVVEYGTRSQELSVFWN